MDDKKGIKMTNYIFYHIFLCDRVNEIITEQLNRLIKSEILDSSDLFICITDIYNNQFPISEVNMELMKKYSIEITIEHQNMYELSTLNKLYNHAKIHDGNYLYFHTKGATRINDNDVKNQYGDYSYKNVENWRHIMEHFNIDQWKVCVDSLKEFDTVGCNYNSTWGQPHYSGNFWWATSEFIKKLPNPMMFFDRMQGEMWISRVKHKSLCLYPIPEENHNRGYVYTPESEYVNNIIKNKF